MKIIKRDLRLEEFTFEKIKLAINRAFIACHEVIGTESLNLICNHIAEQLGEEESVSVETIQDMVETELMKLGYYRVAKAYILYRDKRSEFRAIVERFRKLVPDDEIISLLKDLQATYSGRLYTLELLLVKFQSFYKEDVNILDTLIKASVELITPEAPNWEFVAARLLLLKAERSIAAKEQELGLGCLYDKLCYLRDEGLYGKYMLDAYSFEDVKELEAYIDPTRNHLLTYSGLHLLYKRYLITDHHHNLLERPQEMFMGIAMHLAIPEGKQRVSWAKRIYDILSKLKVTMATPTMSNGRKPLSQLSSCFEDVMPDSLIGIYRTINNFAQVSKFGGGMGIYMGKVRAVGSDIRGFKGVAGGVLKWIKLCNDTAIAVDQLGVRQGSVAIYLDIWHKDMPEFLQIRTNNGDDRMKAHDVFPGVCIPDLFWKMVQEDINGTWYMMCPHEIETARGYCLEDFYGEEWEARYHECLQDNRISKRAISVKEMVRLIIKSAVETGTPFIFNRDTVNLRNPNKHQGIIYCSNLCTEIAQNQKEIQTKKIFVKNEEGQEIVVEETVPGDFVVCNLASLVLGNIDVQDDAEMREVIGTIVRALDNVIDLNFYPIPYARLTNQRMRPIGLGTSGYHHLLAKNGIKWESEEHLDFMDKVFEKINYYAIEASCRLAEEKGKYSYFEGSDWDNGHYFTDRKYTDDKWTKLAAEVHRHGLRNGYLMAVAPTSSTSVIAGTTAGTDPVMNRYFLEEKKGSIVPRVAPQLTDQTYWLYKTAHQMEQKWLVDAAAVRQRHLDQSQSVNLFIDQTITFRGLLDLYLRAWSKGVKTLYYVRSKSLEVEACESCSA